MAASTLTFLLAQLTPLPSISTFARPLNGRTVLLTGGTSGLGLESAKHLVSLAPSRLVCTSRSPDSPASRSAVEEIRRAGEGKVEVQCWELDQARFASVKAVAERFTKEVGELDTLILNAGLVQRGYKETEDGWELMLQVNYLSPTLLALKLLPLLLKARPEPPTPRVVVVTSGLHHRVPDVPEAEAEGEGMLRLLSRRENYEKRPMLRYPLTKLFNILFTRSLSLHLPAQSPLGVNSVNPGLCKSNLAGQLRQNWRFRVYETLLARTAEQGSRTIVHAAVAEELDGKRGEYVEACTLGEASEWVRSGRGEEVAEKLWRDTIEQLTLVDPVIPRIVEQYLA